ncbi:probable histone-lysine N-methyltransferase, H3 lysine-36 and H4 lysine-20 specific isoform at N-terminal half [Coccomyxa sp. Obi]|nr:probable histone-lysine N-methyltransferase, H3 lysine-36 and H4 lysine-20 specific isoform at N-terminal half [Coccomyxa sp. Obi]
MNETKFSLGPALAHFRKLASKHNNGGEIESEVEPMPRAEPLSQGEPEVAKQSESVVELAAGLESSCLDHVPMQLHSQGQKRQQPEPEDDPELSSHQLERPLKRLRKSSPEEAPVSPPTPIPNSLEDSLSNRCRTETCSDGANQEADERALDEDIEEYRDEAREEEEEHNTPEGEWRANDTICPQCDDGGALLLCDGGCMRAFHAGAKLKEAADEDNPEYEDDPESCNPLSIGAEVFMHFETTNDLFECPNCSSHIHQCFVCKQEGSSDPADPDQNVYRCLVASCGRHYHARCLEKTDEEAAALLICPSHTCRKCREPGTEEKGEVIQCRRCPVAYHVGCLPKTILKSPVTRVWITKKYDSEGNPLPPPLEKSRAIEPACEIGQSLLYCLNHPMKVDDATPEHVRPLFTRALKRSWVKKCAERYPELAWSKTVMQKFAEVAKARQEAAERKRLQAAQEAAAARAPKAAMKRVEARPAVSAVAAAAGAPRRPASAKTKPGAPAKKTAQLTSDDEDVPLGQRIAADKRKQDEKAAGARVAEAESFIPLEDDVPGGSNSTMNAPNSGSKQSRTRSVSAAHPSAQQSSKKQPAPAGELSAASVQAGAPKATEKGSEHSRADLPAALPDVPEAADESAPPSPGMGVADAAASAPAPPPAAVATPLRPEDDMWSADADEDADEADREDAQAAAEAALPDAAAEQAALERAAEEAAAAAAAEEEAFLLPCERESHWTRSKMQERLNMYFGEAEHANQFAHVLASARKPEPYNMPAKQTVAQDRLNNFKVSVQKADELPEYASMIITNRDANELFQHEDNLRMVLAPILHGERYTSYGRHFTLPPLLEEVNRYLMPFLRLHDTVVDFSCGYNVWVPMLKCMCLENGWEIHGKSFDIITAKDIEDFTKDTWFNVKPGQLGPPDRLVIGLNPPFGKDGTLANKFVERAALYHQPRIIVLIVPPLTKIPDGYVVLLEDTELMRGEAFFKPGVDKASWNDTTPSTRILVRHDHYEQARHLVGPHTTVTFEHAYPPVQMQPLHMYNQMPLPLEQPMYNMAF